MKYSELSNDDKSNLTYSQLLGLNDWQVLRKKIINRDNYICSICSKESTEKYISGDLIHFGSPSIHFYEPSGHEKDFKLELIITKRVSLHVHHTYYDLSNLPWQYPTESLQSLCAECHQNIHDTTDIPVYRNGNLIDDIKTCSRCNGSGYIHQFNYHMNGVCFMCNGDRYYLK